MPKEIIQEQMPKEIVQEQMPQEIITREQDKEPVIYVLLQPEEKKLEIPRKKAKNVERLLIHLGIRPYTALVARDGIPITPDTPLLADQNIIVRKVMSSG